MLSYSIAVASIGLVHALLPTHWLPFVLMGRGQQWSLRQTVGVALLASIGHVAVTTAIGFLAAWVGIGLFHHFHEWSEMAYGLLLLLFGITYTAFNIGHLGHRHLAETGGVPDHVAVISVILMLSLSPCMALLPIFFAASPMGWGPLVFLAGVNALATVGGMILVTGLVYAGVMKIQLPWLQKYERRLVGGLIALLGLVVMFSGGDHSHEGLVTVLYSLFHIGEEFLYLLVETLPFFVVGTFGGAILLRFLRPETTNRFFGGSISGVVNAGVLGALLPGCATATIPLASGLRSQRVGVGTLAAFIMIAPLLSPLTLSLTYGMLGWKFALARLILPFLMCLPLGWTLNWMETRKFAGVARPSQVEAGCHSHGSCFELKPEDGIVRNTMAIARGLGGYFLLGLLIAAAAIALVPKDALSRLTQSAFWTYPLAAGVGMPFYVCEGEEVPLTRALLYMGVGVGPAFTFMLASVGTCIPTILMAPKLIGRVATWVYVVAWVVFAIMAGVLVSFVL
ncbi:MAG: permease [Candidatus Omnitrophica bacterium]|nr:permease [Candidatus Omnitrophota bacterium]